MAIIMNLDTSTTNCYVCLSNNGKIFFLMYFLNYKCKQSDFLYSLIYYTLINVKLKIYSINAIGFSKGPGSYTGLRVGTSSVKGLCYGLNIPLIAINTLDIMVHTVTINKGILIPMIDAPNDKVYTAIYNHKKQRLSNIMSLRLNQNSFKEYFGENIFIFGNGAIKAKKIIKIPFKYIYINGIYYKIMGYIYECAFKKKRFENIDLFEPIYL
jgi:tRNA threonylcarbamoyladenosine biosynthesis protein TsaB